MFIREFYNLDEKPGCNMTEEGRSCPEHGLTECPGYKMIETSARDKLHQRHQELRKKSGLPNPNYYKELLTTFDLPDEERWAKVAEIKKKYGVSESFNRGKVDFNFNIDDLRKLEKVHDIDKLRELAFELISQPSARPMKPEKVEWFRNTLMGMKSRMHIIKLMYDLLLSGEGHAVIGTKHSMKANTYRDRFGEGVEKISMTDYDQWRDKIESLDGTVHPQKNRTHLVAQSWDGEIIGEFDLQHKQGYIKPRDVKEAQVWSSPNQKMQHHTEFPHTHTVARDIRSSMTGDVMLQKGERLSELGDNLWLNLDTGVQPFRVEDGERRGLIVKVKQDVEEAIPYALSAANAAAEYRRQGAAGGGYRGRIDIPVQSREDYVAAGKALSKAAKAAGQKIDYGLSDGVMSIFSDSMTSDELDEFIDHVLDQGLAEAGPFSYGAKKPKKGSVADLAAKKRKEQERGKQPIEPLDQMVGVAKVLPKDVAETSDYFRRRQREEEIISGKKSARKKQPAQTSDYARRREQEKKQDVAEGYWQDAVKKAEASKEARKGKPFEKNPLSHDKHGVYKGDKDLAGDPVPKKKKQGVGEGVTSPEIKQAYADIMKTKPHTPERKAAVKKYQALRTDALEKKKQDVEEAKHFRTAYGWAGGRNEKTGKMYKHPEQIKADRQKKQGISKDAETEFHSKLDNLVHDTFGKRRGEMEESLMPGEYYTFKVYFDDGSEETLNFSSDDIDWDKVGARRGKKVVNVKRQGGIQGSPYGGSTADPYAGARERQDQERAAQRAYDRRLSEDIEKYVEELERAGYGVVTESATACPECGGPAYSNQILAEKQDACYHKVKSRYKVWPSAYASGALVRCRKVGAKNWGNKSQK